MDKGEDLRMRKVFPCLMMYTSLPTNHTSIESTLDTRVWYGRLINNHSTFEGVALFKIIMCHWTAPVCASRGFVLRRTRAKILLHLFYLPKRNRFPCLKQELKLNESMCANKNYLNSMKIIIRMFYIWSVPFSWIDCRKTTIPHKFC